MTHSGLGILKSLILCALTSGTWLICIDQCILQRDASPIRDGESMQLMTAY